MVVKVNQRSRGHLEVTTQVLCPLVTALDTNGTLSFQSPTAQEGDPISSSTLPGEGFLPAQLPIQQGSLPSGTTIVPAALRDTKLSLKGDRRHVPSSMQKETEQLQKPEGCERRRSVGLLEETHGRRKSRQNTNMFCASSPTSTQSRSTRSWSLGHQETVDLMEGSSTMKVSLPPVTGSGVLRCQTTSNPLQVGRRTEEQLASRSSVANSASGQSNDQSLCDLQYHKPTAQPISQPHTRNQATSSRYIGLRDKPLGGNWAKVVSPTNYDRTMLKAERWPSIDESFMLSSCRMQASVDQGGWDLGKYNGLTGSQLSQAEMQRAYPTERRRHLSPLKPNWFHNQVRQVRSDWKCLNTSLDDAATKGFSKVKPPCFSLPTLNLKCIGKGVTLKQAPRLQSRILLPPLAGRRHTTKDNLLTPRGKRKLEGAASKSEATSRNRLSPVVSRSEDTTGVAIASSSHEKAVSRQVNSGELGAIEPVLLMVNRDFAVKSPVKNNLLLTIALSQHKDRQGLDNDTGQEQGHSGEATCSQKCGQILVGQFTAFSSLMGFGLGYDARRVASEQNAGGSSTISESLSVEYFVRRFQAKDVVTEMEVEYTFMNMKKVDYICSIFGQRVGVSVTRAMSYPDPKNFNADTAVALLRKKLFGLVVARSGVTSRHSFSQCILHVWCETRNTAKILEEKYPEISTEMQVAEDVIMVLTVAEGSQARPIFYEACLNSKLSSAKEFLWCF